MWKAFDKIKEGKERRKPYFPLLRRFFTKGMKTNAPDMMTDKIKGPSISSFPVSTMKQMAAHSRARITICGNDKGLRLMAVSLFPPRPCPEAVPRRKVCWFVFFYTLYI